MTLQGGRRLSRRQRHVAWTASLLTIALVGGAAVWYRGYRGSQPGLYRPGEANAEITDSLTRDLPRDAPRPVFVDTTADAGLAGVSTFSGARTSQLPEDMGPGAAWGDYDNDGDDDLFVVSAGGALGTPVEQLAPSALFENLGNGRFQRVAGFPEPRIIGMGAAWGDYDGDGWLDLVVTGYNAILLFRNDMGKFVLDSRFRSRDGFWAGAAWGDYDNDGRLDLYISGYVKYVKPSSGQTTAATKQYGKVVPYTLNPASYAPERNLLFRNAGRGSFVETAERLGVSNPEGRSLSALWHDFDDDGWIDLYVANDISDNVMYRNTGGRFTDVSHAAWVADYRGAMGLAAGDWNRDGDDDLFVTHWIAQENALYDSLLKDSANFRFVDAADTFGIGQIALPMVGWGVEFLDFDSDGWLDVAVANGSTFETDGSPKRLVPQLPFLFWNRRGEHFHNVAPLAPPLAQPQNARGLTVSDYDNDGDQDILIARHGGGVQLLRNDTRSGQRVQIVLRARPIPGAPAGVARGASAVARVGPARLRRSVTSASYLSQSTSVLHFGLGAASSIDRLTVRWRGNVVSAYGPLAAGKRWEITEGDPAPKEMGTAAVARGGSGQELDRQRIVAFWDRQRAGMHALKIEKNGTKAIGLFREALALDAAHEDTRYYLATALAAEGNTDAALAEYAELTRVNSRSHRGIAEWGKLRAMTFRNAGDLAAAEEALAKAHDLNPEETGTLIVMAEVALMRGDDRLAQRRLESVCQANPRAAGALFILGYLQWKEKHPDRASQFLERARQALGPDWKPAGTTAEGDVRVAARPESTPLSRFWNEWDGTTAAPARVYARLDMYLRAIRR